MTFGFKKLPILLATIFFIASVVAFVLLYKEIDKNKKATEEIETKWQEEYLRRQEMKTLDKAVQSIQEEKQQLDMHFAKSSDIVPFLNTIEKLIKDAGTKGQVVSVDILKDNQGLSIGIKAEGKFENVYKLLMLLENSPYKLEMMFVDIAKIEGENVGEKSSTAPKWEGIFKLRLISFLP